MAKEASTLSEISLDNYEREVLDVCDADIAKFSEMTRSERYFLNGLIRKYRPKKIMEIGVAAGGASAVILNAIRDIPDAHLFSVDSAEHCYRDDQKNVGYAVHELFPELLEKWSLMPGTIAARRMDEIGGNIDLCLLDTTHTIPGELLEYLTVLPYMRSPGIVVIHAIAMHTANLFDIPGAAKALPETFNFAMPAEKPPSPSPTACCILLSAIHAEKLYPLHTEHTFVNIGAAILGNFNPAATKSIFNLLTLPWGYAPYAPPELRQLTDFLGRHYPKPLVDIFRKAADVNRRYLEYRRKRQAEPSSQRRRFQNAWQLAGNIRQLSHDEFELNDAPPESNEEHPIVPAFAKNNTTVLFAADNRYAPYLGVALRSLYDNSNPRHNYDIIVIETGIIPDVKRNIRRCCENERNFSIRFISLGQSLQNYMAGMPVTYSFQPSAYYRLLAPALLRKHEKIVYLDSDLLVLTDIADLFNIELGDNCLAACRDLLVAILSRKDVHLLDYVVGTLQMERISDYFNSGVLVLDLARMREENSAHGLDQALEWIGTPLFVDQDLLNLLYRNRVAYLSPEWNNCGWNVHHSWENVRHRITEEEYNREVLSAPNAKILHFASGTKPWTNPGHSLADLFWHYARRTPFYEALLYRLTEAKLAIIGKA